MLEVLELGIGGVEQLSAAKEYFFFGFEVMWCLEKGKTLGLPRREGSLAKKSPPIPYMDTMALGWGTA